MKGAVAGGSGPTVAAGEHALRFPGQLLRTPRIKKKF